MSSNHSLYKEFEKQMRTMVGSFANNNAAPMMGVIENISEDCKTVDVRVNKGLLKGIEAFGYPVKNTKVMLVFLDGSYDTPIAVCNSLNMLEYQDPTPTYNVLNNGNFQKYSNGAFSDWNGGKRSTTNYWFNKSTMMIEPLQTVTSSYYNIEDLRDNRETNDGDFTVIMVFYYYLGAIELSVREQEKGLITFAPENLGHKKETLSYVDEWYYKRTVFLLRDNKNVQVSFKNIDKNRPAYIDGVRLWTQDFHTDWYPSKNDKEAT